MTEHAFAKLNLSLDVLGKTGDGYHALRSVMQSVEFGDDIEIELTEDGSFSIEPGKPYLPADEKNLALRAAMLFLAGSGRGARIRVEKRIPVGAGLGGGSCDAAAVLRALNRFPWLRREKDELLSLALRLGSDVPFCLEGGTCLAEGRGEVLTAVSPLPDCRVVICKPSFSISTAELFNRVDARRARTRPDTPGLLRALAEGSLTDTARRCYNVFEDVLNRPQRETVNSIKSTLLEYGAIGAAMTGTGSAVFGLFAADGAAQRARAALSKHFRECFLTRPVPALDTDK